jgi:rhodanese-related sulfurtransferase
MSHKDWPPVLSVGDVAELLKSEANARLLDVRTPGEYESVHIRGAYNVPLDTLAEHATEIRANVADPIVLVCQSGQRARVAEEALKEGGLRNLHVLDGGVNGWVKAGQPVVRGAKRMSLERQVRIVAGMLAGMGGVLALSFNPVFALLSVFVGSGLVFAGVTDTCGMAMVLSRLPYNRAVTCDVSAMVRALSDGDAPVGVGRAAVREAKANPSCAAC